MMISIVTLGQHVAWRRKMDDLYTVKDRRIPREEISNLLWSMGSDISTHSLSMWLKSKTNDEWVVMPREFCLLGFVMLDENREEWDVRSSSKEFIKQGLEELALSSKEEFLEKRDALNFKYLDQIEKYL